MAREEAFPKAGSFQTGNGLDVTENSVDIDRKAA
jgi:hypothetical protein